MTRYRRAAQTVLAVGFVLLGSGFAPSGVAAGIQAACTFTLGFKAVRDQIPDVVGDCLEKERFNPRNGNAEQRTTRGLLVWRQVDNWTVFTDGSTTWVNGPEGLQSRPNGERFPWEAAAPTPAPASLLPPERVAGPAVGRVLLSESFDDPATGTLRPGSNRFLDVGYLEGEFFIKRRGEVGNLLVYRGLPER